MKWFEEDFDKETANQFLNEMKKATDEFILNQAKEMLNVWPLKHTLPKQHYPFTPKGAIIHSTDTPSLWNSLHKYTRNVYSTHFLICSDGRILGGIERYPLLSQVPATMFMLYPIDECIPHSGYISQLTWGIDLRNTGRLRPVKKDQIPMPILPSEETNNNFIVNMNSNINNYDLYWKQNLWTSKINCPHAIYDKYFYELPTKQQIISLIVLLRVLNKYTDLDSRLIVPSNCINGGHPRLPYIIWNTIRRLTKKYCKIDENTDYLNYLSTDHCIFEGHDVENETEGLISEQIDKERWRSELDNGQKSSLLSKRTFKKAKLYHKTLEYFGYDTKDLDYSIRMCAITNNVDLSRDEDIYNVLNKLR